MANKLKLVLKIISINFFFILLFIIIIELIFGNWFKSNNYGNLIIPRYQVKLINNPPYKTEKLGIYSRDKNGFRANTYNLSNINTLVVGGSTTEERYVDDQLIWTKVLDNNLLNTEYEKVLNAGIGGQTSFGHIRIFDLWFSRFDDLKPKIILFYIGINDALYMLESIKKKQSTFKGRLVNDTDRDNLIHKSSSDQLIQYLKNNSVFRLFYKIIQGNIIAWKYKIKNKSKNSYLSKPKYIKDITQNVDVNSNDFENYTHIYKDNLSKLVIKSEEFNAIPVFITQVVAKDHWLKNYVSKINSHTIEFCSNNKIVCINLADDISIGNTVNFHDGIHTTPIGSKKIGDLIGYNLF